jgi:GMP synthase PP-ATPase subunit
MLIPLFCGRVTSVDAMTAECARLPYVLLEQISTGGINLYTKTIKDLEKRLWDTADELRANSGLKASEYSTPI